MTSPATSGRACGCSSRSPACSSASASRSRPPGSGTASTRPARPEQVAPDTIAGCRPRSSSRPDPGVDDVPLLTNGELARIFHDIGDMLEVKGELVFKTVAYHRAADAIAHSPVEVAAAYRAGTPPRIAGVGQAISDKIAELARTGHLAFYDRLVAEVPPSLVELLRIPGVGPRTVRILNEELGIETLEDLRQAAEAGRLRTVKGLSEKTEQSVLEGIAALEARESRMLLDNGRGAHRDAHRRADRHAGRRSRSIRPGRSAAGARRSATSTCSPRRPIRRRSSRASRPSHRSTRSSGRARTRPPSACSAGRRST